ncbi:alpha/beta hydrolase [Amycolatopsis jiangsuensis]|uniref:Pimeloyl-ACP methyl ester carboxylesterase n=1 Tax=Amycolatopsis jiangsuensis TaxID=1181879 RepID=A0A840IZ78_9PSEU|nr:alpha/beta hydrolase [Amycolatopsis jiangsuensis]MBB4686819.1 pimeloyl-ACP methyl ester carboxylesterase [Amycolatopsis jiangsuensis]
MRRKLSVALAAAALMATVVPAASAEASETLEWGACPKGVEGPRLECSTLKVPLDYRDPDGKQIEIAVSRLASENPARRRGVLLTNPGGPGGEGLGYPALLAGSGLPQEVLDSYDLIGFDPRGVAHSTPVTCELTPEQQARGAFSSYAETAADVTREADYARTIARQCATSPTAQMLPHTTTANTARDMERIRVALGEPKISYLGASYGTYLGAAYASMFPDRGDRIVLDSNLGPGGYDYTAMRGFARGMEDRFPDFADYAAAHPEYGLGTTPERVTAKFFDLAKRLDATPVHGVNGLAFRGVTFEYLYADASFPTLAKTWQLLDTNQPLPEQPSTDHDNTMSARLYVVCGDSRWPDSVGDYQHATAVDRVKYPMLGGSTANIGPCAFWPKQRPEPPVHIGNRGPSNVLMVQNERDPGTPLTGARALRQAFGQRARLVTADQGGHGVYPWGKNTCVNDAATEFLTAGQRPAHDLACTAESGK